ncbi:unnamed protein product [Malus baccata var. baccata]
MNDEKTQEIIQARNQGKKKDFRIRKTDGMLMHENMMYVLNNTELKKEILDEAHISAYAMHPGGTKMYHTIRPFYYWPGVKREIAEYVSRCAIFQQVKAERKKLFGLMQPVPIPQWKWENITMDFVYKLHCTHNGVVRFGKKGKLSPRYIEPYLITERVGEVAYRLELPPELSKVHNVFHVSMLRHYVSDPSHGIPPQPVEINPDLTYDEELMTILDWKDKELRNKTVCLVKVLWRNHSME